MRTTYTEDDEWRALDALFAALPFERPITINGLLRSRYVPDVLKVEYVTIMLNRWPHTAREYIVPEELNAILPVGRVIHGQLVKEATP
jgi:hypothetical protein